jgi:hypothetical protein
MQCFSCNKGVRLLEFNTVIGVLILWVNRAKRRPVASVAFDIDPLNYYQTEFKYTLTLYSVLHKVTEAYFGLLPKKFQGVFFKL